MRFYSILSGHMLRVASQEANLNFFLTAFAYYPKLYCLVTAYYCSKKILFNTLWEEIKRKHFAFSELIPKFTWFQKYSSNLTLRKMSHSEQHLRAPTYLVQMKHMKARVSGITA